MKYEMEESDIEDWLKNLNESPNEMVSLITTAYVSLEDEREFLIKYIELYNSMSDNRINIMDG